MDHCGGFKLFFIIKLGGSTLQFTVVDPNLIVYMVHSLVTILLGIHK